MSKKLKILSLERNKKSVFSTVDGFHFIENPIEEVINSGVKECYNIKTYYDNNLILSEDHKIQTLEKEELIPLKHVVKKNMVFLTSRDNGKSIETDHVIECKNIGFRNCFDLKLKNNPHTFFANNICVSNSHAISYGTVSYLMMYIKTYYPIFFYTYHLEICSEAETPKFVMESSKYGVKIEPVNVNVSKDKFFAYGDKIFWSLKGIKGLGPAAVYGICKNQPFNSLEDFCNKKSEMKCTKAMILALVKENAFKDFYIDLCNTGDYKQRLFEAKKLALVDTLKYLKEYPEDQKELIKKLEEEKNQKILKNKWNAISEKRYEKLLESNIEKQKNLKKYFSEYLVDGDIEKILLSSDKMKDLISIRELNKITDDISSIKSDTRDGEMSNNFICYAFFNGGSLEKSKTKTKTGKDFYKIFLTDFSDEIRLNLFSNSFENYGKNINTGLPVKVRVSKQGKYWNIVSIIALKK